MEDSDEEDLFAPKATTKSGRSVQPSERYVARPHAAANGVSDVMLNLEFLQKMIREDKHITRIAKNSGIDAEQLKSAVVSNDAVDATKPAKQKTAEEECHWTAQAKQLCGGDSNEDDKNNEESHTGKALFKPTPSICRAPLQMSPRARSFLLSSNFPGGVDLIESLMSAEGGWGMVGDNDDAWIGGQGDEGVDDMLLEQWLDAMLAVTSTRATAHLEALGPFFYRLAVSFPYAITCLSLLSSIHSSIHLSSHTHMHMHIIPSWSSNASTPPPPLSTHLRLQAFHSKMSVKQKAVNLAARSLRPGPSHI
jgi:hypothetical protein